MILLLSIGLLGLAFGPWLYFFVLIPIVTLTETMILWRVFPKVGFGGNMGRVLGMLFVSKIVESAISIFFIEYIFYSENFIAFIGIIVLSLGGGLLFRAMIGYESYKKYEENKRKIISMMILSGICGYFASIILSFIFVNAGVDLNIH